jgi:hypothetical protein
MKTLFKTKVVNRKRATNHRLGIGEMPQPVIVQLSICEGSGGFFLFHEDDEGACIFDNWVETVDQAKRHADHMYEITGWVAIAP